MKFRLKMLGKTWQNNGDDGCYKGGFLQFRNDVKKILAAIRSAI